VNDADSIPTRQSLLARLKDVRHPESWRDFFDTYWRLIHAAAVKAGLTDCEAQEVVQEVMTGAAKKTPEFTYEPGKDSESGIFVSSYSENGFRGKARPRPGPLPQEREKLAQCPEILTLATAAPSHEDLRRLLHSLLVRADNQSEEPETNVTSPS
jgi:hypothetical protein